MSLCNLQLLCLGRAHCSIYMVAQLIVNEWVIDGYLYVIVIKETLLSLLQKDTNCIVGYNK
jgi:hypothetical protein